jgi:hypothetical protein
LGHPTRPPREAAGVVKAFDCHPDEEDALPAPWGISDAAP